MSNAANNNVIGSGVAGAGNVISGNSQRGVSVDSSVGNTIAGNYIGTNAAGTAAQANAWSGVELINSSNNTVGGATVAARNIISGNTERGVYLNGADNNQILGNYVGLNAAGATAIGNGWSGVELSNAADNNTIGGDAIVNGGNRIFGSGQNGVAINGGSTGNKIGGAAVGAGNIVSSNSLNGIAFDASTGNTVKGNYIGTNVAGTAAAPNAWSGISLTNGANGNTIGGTSIREGNVISGNSHHGLSLNASANNTVVGNYVGINAAGTTAIGNAWNGIDLSNASNANTIGGAATGARNVISGNADHAIYITGSISNLVQGNYIGTNAAGTAIISNGSDADTETVPLLINVNNGTAVVGNNNSGNPTTGVSVDGGGSGISEPSSSTAGEGNQTTSDPSAKARRFSNAQLSLSSPTSFTTISLDAERGLLTNISMNRMMVSSQNSQATAEHAAQGASLNTLQSLASRSFNIVDDTVSNLIQKWNIVSQPALITNADSSHGFEVKFAPEQHKKFSGFANMQLSHAEAAGALLSLGTVWLTVQQATLVASIAATAPVLQGLDPLPIFPRDELNLENNVDRKRDKEESVDYLFDE
ncbi:MAG: hypothetical protein V4568_19960 [Pseudomonadota bacterium]